MAHLLNRFLNWDAKSQCRSSGLRTVEISAGAETPEPIHISRENDFEIGPKLSRTPFSAES